MSFGRLWRVLFGWSTVIMGLILASPLGGIGDGLLYTRSAEPELIGLLLIILGVLIIRK